jgi:hypothetical protein
LTYFRDLQAPKDEFYLEKTLTAMNDISAEKEGNED